MGGGVIIKPVLDALGAALGGLAGKELFSIVAQCFSNAESAGGVQAVILLLATLATLLYTCFKGHVATYHICQWAPCFLIGLALGMLGSFLGIGGGPFNMAALYFFFSMSTKTAAQNSLYVILISQLAGLSKTVLSGAVPEISPYILVGMIACSVFGSEIGGRINACLSEKNATVLFECSMVLILFINTYNINKFPACFSCFLRRFCGELRLIDSIVQYPLQK